MRKLLVFLAASSLGFLLVAVALTTTLVLTFTPTNVKKWLRGSNVYSTIVDDLIKQSQAATSNNANAVNLTDNQPEVQSAIKKAFSPQFLQTSTEQFIDGVTPWLEGKTPQPTFQIDVSGAKLAFVNSLADNARTRYASLPVCTGAQVPDVNDILNSTCRVPGVSIEPQIQQAISQLANSKEFLPNSVITAANVNTNDNGVQKPLFEQLRNIPKWYQRAHILPYVLGALALLSALIVIFVSTERRKGIRHTLIVLGSSAAILLASIWLVGFGTTKAQEQLAKSAAQNSGIAATGLAIIKEIQHDTNGKIITFAIIYAAIASGLLLYLLLSRPKSPKPEHKNEEGPSEPKAEEQKPAEPTSKTKPPVLVQSQI